MRYIADDRIYRTGLAHDVSSCSEAVAFMRDLVSDILLGSALAALFTIAVLGPAISADCDVSLAQARVVAEAITVNIEVPQRARVGEPIKVSWGKRVDDRPQVP